MTPVATGRIFLVAAAFLWAVETSLFAAGAPTYGAAQFLCYRNVFIVLFSLLLLGFGRKLRLLKVTTKELPWLIYVAIGSGIIADFGFYYALQYVPIVNGLVIAHLQPFFMILFGYLFFREQPLSRPQIVGGIIMFFASLLVSAGTLEELSNFRFGAWQNLIILGSAILWADSALRIKHHLTHLHPSVVILYRYLIAAPVIGFFFVSPEIIQAPNFIVAANGLAVFGGISLWFLGLRVLPAPEVGFLELLSPLFGIILGALFISQEPTLFQVMGSLLMFVGFWGLTKEKKSSINFW